MTLRNDNGENASAGSTDGTGQALPQAAARCRFSSDRLERDAISAVEKASRWIAPGEGRARWCRSFEHSSWSRGRRRVAASARASGSASSMPRTLLGVGQCTRPDSSARVSATGHIGQASLRSGGERRNPPINSSVLRAMGRTACAMPNRAIDATSRSIRPATAAPRHRCREWEARRCGAVRVGELFHVVLDRRASTPAGDPRVVAAAAASDGPLSGP